MFNRDRKEYMKKYGIQWRIDNKEKNKERQKQYYIDNKERIKAQQEQYYKNEDNREKRKQYYRDRRKIDLGFKFNSNLSNMIRQSLKGNKAGRHWEDLVGYTLNDLIKRLKKTIPEGYDWQDYLDGKLHIDHKIPISAFNFTKSEHTDFERCWALNNLRLLPARENMIKRDKLTRPFQPALAI